MKQKINVVVCGFTPLNSLFLNILVSLEQLYNLCGYWNPAEKSSIWNNSFKKIEGSFSDVVKSSLYDVIFICYSPQVQFKLLQSFLPEAMSPTECSAKKAPFLIVLPPVSPSYETPFLMDCKNAFGVAMPFRKLTSMSFLIYHLNYITERASLNILKLAQSLPSHWTLGELHGLHFRLSVKNPIRPNQYSWLCEPGPMGGGLTNLYVAGLVDLAFHLTGGLRISSLSSLCRTFDSQVCTDPTSIRRINSEDYVLVSAELESLSSDASRPVVMFCVSADHPPGYNDFSLSVEMTGSAGRVILPISGNEVCWTKLNSVVSTVNTSPTVPGSNFSSAVGSVETLVNGFSNHLAHNGEIVQNSQKKIGYGYSLHLDDRGSEESATIYLENPVGESIKPSKCAESPLLTEAWTQWLVELSDALHDSNPTQSLELLVAFPDHWDYIQRVVNAIDKSSRMRCWIDVATGERV